MQRRDQRAGEVAEQQEGCLQRAQLDAFSGSAIFRRIRAGRWKRALPGVYVIHGARDHWEQRLRAALLWAGPAATVSHLSAGAWYQLDGVKEGPIEVTTPRAQRLRHPNVVVHRSLRLGPADVTRHRGLRITCMARTLVDLASLGDPQMLELALECALRRRQVSRPSLGAYLDRMEPRRRGLPILRRLVADRGGRVPTDSALEVRVFRLLREAGLYPRRQYILHWDGRHVAKVDFAFPRERLALLCDGFEYHSSYLAWHRDRDVISQLAAMGWRAVQVTWRDVEQRPDELVRRVQSALIG